MAYNLLLKNAREALGLSQEDLAEAVGVAPQTVSDWERGENYPLPYFRKKLVATLGKSAAELGFLSAGGPALVSYDPLIPLPTPLIGRDEIISQARQRLNSKKTRFIVFVGLPGAGKTALAATLTQDPKVHRQFDGILWAGLGPHPEYMPLLSRWGRLLGTRGLIGTQEAWRERIRSALATRPFLLVIDDAWKPEDVFFLQVGGPQCVYLITTRFPRLAATLTADGVVPVGELSVNEGMEVVRRLAPQIVDRGAEQTLNTLVQAVGGLPLALTLMGNYLRTRAYSGPSRRLTDAFEHLSHAEARLHLSELFTPAEDAQSEQRRSLYAIIALADDFLSREVHQALQVLAATFPAKPGGFTEEEALTVVPNVDLLDALLDAGLLEWSSEDRYTIHQVVADYASFSS